MKIGMIMALLCALLGACGRTESVRYKMTVEVETPEGLKSGSAVRKVTYYEPPPFPSIGENRGYVEVIGEAVVVDLPGGKSLFALLTNEDGDVDYGSAVIQMAYPDMRETRVDDPLPKESVFDRMDDTPQAVEIWPTPPKRFWARGMSATPMLVKFRDIADPNSVVRVDPTNLMASFGWDVELKRITVQVTDEPVTVGIEKRLPPPYVRSFVYTGETSEALRLYKGKHMTEELGARDFMRGAKR
jgi:hypothetical protein